MHVINLYAFRKRGVLAELQEWLRLNHEERFTSNKFATQPLNILLGYGGQELPSEWHVVLVGPVKIF